MRTSDPSTYFRVIAAILPKALEMENVTPESGLTDEQVEEYYALLKAKFSDPERQKADGTLVLFRWALALKPPAQPKVAAPTAGPPTGMLYDRRMG